MSIIYKERPSDSPYVESIIQGWTASDGSTTRPAECSWHMVFVRWNGNLQSLVVGPWTTAGVASWGEGAEILWIKFSLGAFMPHLPTIDLRDAETVLPGAASSSFWLKGSAWQVPDYDNVETFIERLVRAAVLAHDQVVSAALQGRAPQVPSRTVRHRFLRTTGLTQSHICRSNAPNGRRRF